MKWSIRHPVASVLREKESEVPLRAKRVSMTIILPLNDCFVSRGWRTEEIIVMLMEMKSMMRRERESKSGNYAHAWWSCPGNRETKTHPLFFFFFFFPLPLTAKTSQRKEKDAFSRSQSSRWRRRRRGGQREKETGGHQMFSLQQLFFKHSALCQSQCHLHPLFHGFFLSSFSLSFHQQKKKDTQNSGDHRFLFRSGSLFGEGSKGL